jgi:hypothetical protein
VSDVLAVELADGAEETVPEADDDADTDGLTVVVIEADALAVEESAPVSVGVAVPPWLLDTVGDPVPVLDAVLEADTVSVCIGVAVAAELADRLKEEMDDAVERKEFVELFVFTAEDDGKRLRARYRSSAATRHATAKTSHRITNSRHP